MLLSEQVRRLSSEERLINDATVYTRSGARAWGTLHSYGNITLAAAALIVFKFTIGTSGWDGRLKIGGLGIWGKCAVSTGTITGIAYVDAGTHTVLFEDASAGGSGSNISAFQLGKIAFSDEVGSVLAAYSSQISKTVAARTTCAGPLNSAVVMVRCWAYTSGGQTNFENIADGGGLTNGVQLAIDSSQVDWTERNQDTGSIETASAYHFSALSIGAAHTFDITKDNAATVVHISIYICPWLLYATAHEPVSLVVPNGSTLYVTTEPLDANPTKYIYIGKVRAVSYGDSTDYYYVGTPAAGIMSDSYTFELVAVAEVGMTLKGLGACIAYIAVDVK